MKLQIKTGLKVGMTNPAATFCEEQGGQSIIVPTPSGDVGHCLIDEWKMYRSCNPSKPTPPPPMPLLR